MGKQQFGLTLKKKSSADQVRFICVDREGEEMLSRNELQYEEARCSQEEFECGARMHEITEAEQYKFRVNPAQPATGSVQASSRAERCHGERGWR